MPDLTHRSSESELMDDFAITDERLTRSLDQLRKVNQFLGGYSAVFNTLLPYMLRNQNRTLRILDIGSGIGDICVFLLQDTGIRRWDVDFTITDFNPATMAHARRYVSKTLDSSVRNRITLLAADANHLPFPNKSFDIVMASMFLHHFPAPQATEIVREMNRVARDGVLINDLQRNEFAYFAIKAITSLLPATEMVRHDAPLSVARAFTGAELYRIGRKAGLKTPKIKWAWAFRWILKSGKL